MDGFCMKDSQAELFQKWMLAKTQLVRSRTKKALALVSLIEQKEEIEPMKKKRKRNEDHENL